MKRGVKEKARGYGGIHTNYTSPTGGCFDEREPKTTCRWDRWVCRKGVLQPLVSWAPSGHKVGCQPLVPGHLAGRRTRRGADPTVTERRTDESGSKTHLWSCEAVNDRARAGPQGAGPDAVRDSAVQSQRGARKWTLPRCSSRPALRALARRSINGDSRAPRQDGDAGKKNQLAVCMHIGLMT